MTPLAVDIVINNHDYGRFVAAAIDSALAQRHRPLQVVVVDDGSTDTSRAIIAGYADRVVTVLKANGGQASAFNAGFARCRGDVVIFLDADDVLEPGAARRVVAAFESVPGAAKVQYRMAVLDATGRRTGELKPPGHLGMPSGDVIREELTFPFDLTWMPTSGNAFAARVLERLLPMPEAEFRLGADWYLQHLTPLFGPVVSLDAVGAGYRVHRGNRYERADAELDLDHVRQSIRYAAGTRRHLGRVAAQLGVPRRPGPILSVADLGNRLISRRLDPRAHPLPADRAPRLALAGAVAAARRWDVRWTLKLLFTAWFALMAAAPRPLAARLAALFLFPERRARLNPWLARAHRREPA